MKPLDTLRPKATVSNFEPPNHASDPRIAKASIDHAPPAVGPISASPQPLPGTLFEVDSDYTARLTAAQTRLDTAKVRLSQHHAAVRAEHAKLNQIETKLAGEISSLGTSQTEYGEALMEGTPTSAIQQRVAEHQTAITALEGLAAAARQRLAVLDEQLLRLSHGPTQAQIDLDNATFWHRAAVYAKNISPFEADREWLAENARVQNVNIQQLGSAVYTGPSKIGHLTIGSDGRLLARQF